MIPVQVSGSSTFVTVRQVPGVAAHVWQASVHAEEQQYPSLHQRPSTHSRQPDTLQSVVALHCDASVLRSRQEPFAPQKLSAVQSASPEQMVGHCAAPVQTNGAHDTLAPGWPAATIVQVPGVTLHTSQPPAHEALQQYPSTHRVLAHSDPLEQVWPFFFLHTATASHVVAPPQLSPSSALVTVVQAPGADAQVLQASVQEALQQRPSAQNVLAHSDETLQLCPFFLPQVPEALQVMVPVQVSASSAVFTAVQVPAIAEQVWQLPAHDTLQQIPSAQLPDWHWEPDPQLPPSAWSGWHVWSDGRQ
jgi:hypothetical protein